MEQLKTLLANLTLWQKVTIGIVAAGLMVGLWSLSHLNRERDFRPLYTGLASEDAGIVMAKLKEAGVEYRVGDGGSLLVPSGKVAELRLQMAAAGLPRTGRIGYELFDKTNLGQTEFAEQVNFRRALEGELERSIAALTEVESARVHLVFPKDSVFLDSRQPAKASVLLKLRVNTRLSPANVTAIQHLTASAVEGLQPEAVAVLDMNGSLLSRKQHASNLDTGEPSDAALDYRERIEKLLLAKVNATLEPLLGPDRFRAGVTVDCDFTSAEQSEESFDPAKSVMTSSQKTEDVSNGSSQGGVPGTASALPRPAARAGGAGTSLSRRSENLAFQTSRTVKHTKLPQGGIKRLSVSVLLDQRMRWEGTGPKAKRVFEPFSAEKLKTIKEVVAAATGIIAERGDQVVVESLAFDATLNGEPPAAVAVSSGPASDQFPAWWPAPLRKAPVLIGIGLAVALLLGGVMVLTMRKKKTATVSSPAAIAAADAKKAGNSAEELGAESPAALRERLAAEVEARRQNLLSEAEHLSGIAIPQSKAEVLASHLSDQAKSNPDAIAQLVRTWLMERPR